MGALTPDVLGCCQVFEETPIGGERYNFFTGCPKAKTCTIILRGGAEQFMEETERSLHDAIMIVRRAIKVLVLPLPSPNPGADKIGFHLTCLSLVACWPLISSCKLENRSSFAPKIIKRLQPHIGNKLG